MAREVDESLYKKPEKDEEPEKIKEKPGTDERTPDSPLPDAEQETGEETEEADAPEASVQRLKTSEQPEYYRDEERRGRTTKLLTWLLIAVLFLTVAVMTVSNFVDIPLLRRPKAAVSRIVAPVQRLFSSVTESVASYFRELKIRGNIEYEYEQLLLQIDELASQAAMADEYRRQVEDLYDLMDEMKRNADLDPVSANVIAHDTTNYFSVLTVDAGRRQGIEENMAVVYSGGLVGYTYGVEANSCRVMCIIDGDATVAAMIQSSRDQGSVKGTLSVDGTAMCRMYYLPETSLPRPGDMVVTSGVGVEFPKGIPIGYVRESTRGMDENKSYIVVEPIVDFQHLEYVVIYRYRPAYTEKVQQRASFSEATLEPLITARPQPTFQIGDDLSFESASPEPGETIQPTEEARETESPAPTETANTTAVPENLSYQAPDRPDATPTPTAVPTPSPTPTPAPTFDPGSLTVEEE